MTYLGSSSGGRWLTVRAARLGDGRPREQQDIAVTIESCPPLERADLFARAPAA
jgi:hypothetical protein